MKTLKQLTQRHYFWLLLILWLGFALRLYGLGDVGVNNDESIVYSRWISVSFREIMVEGLLLNNQVFAQILDRISLLVLGDKLFALRWPSVIISALGIALIYRLTRELFDRWIAVLSALLVAISPYSIFFAHTFRGYSWVIVWPILVYLLGLLAVRTGRWRYWLFLGIASASMLYTHLFTILAFFNLMLIIGLIWLFGERLRIKKPSLLPLLSSLALAVILPVVLFAPILVKILQFLTETGGVSLSDFLWVQRPSVSASVWYNLRLFNGFWQEGSIGGDGLYLLTALIFIGLALSLTTRFKWSALAALAWAGLPFVEIWLAQQLFPNFWVRPNYVGYTMPPLLILAGLGIFQLSNLRPFQGLTRPLVALVPILILALFWYVALQEYYQDFTGAGWQTIGKFLQKNSLPGDLVVCHKYDQAWREVDVDDEDLCTRTLDYRVKSDVDAAAQVFTSHEVVYTVLPGASFEIAGRTGRVWLVVWQVPQSAEVSALETTGLTVAEFNHFGRSLLLLVDRQESYVAHLAYALNSLKSTVESPEQKFIYNLLLSVLAAASGQQEMVTRTLEAARKNLPGHPDGPLKLARTESIAESLLPPAIDHPLQVNFGEKILLEGYNINSVKLRPGSNLDLTLFWRAIRPVQQDYSIFLHLRNQAGQIIGQQDYQPFEGSYSTRHWQPGQQLIDRQEIFIPVGVQPGLYDLFIGFYDPITLERLSILQDQSGENAFHLTALSIE